MKIKKFLSQSPIYAIYQTSTLILEDFQRSLAKEDIHLLQGLILVSILFEDRGVRPYELSQNFQIQRSTISHALRGLEKMGWIKREIHSKDARGYTITLSSAGKKKAVALIKVFDRSQDHFEKSLGSKNLKVHVESLHELQRAYLEFT